MTEQEEVLNEIKWLADMNGYDLTQHAPKIANAKLRFFGRKEWFRCPCDPDSDRACISEHCHEDIAKDGTCHCHCYCKKEKQQ